MNDRHRRVMRILKVEQPWKYGMYLIGKTIGSAGLSFNEAASAISIMNGTHRWRKPIKWHKANKGWR